MGLIEEFIERYVKEYDFYSQAARLVAQTLEKELHSTGIRCIVSYRAKDIDRLEDKCRQRAPKKRYRNVSDIFADIVDLAGVRVALYFPGEQEQVENLIAQLFTHLEGRKVFPGEDGAERTERFAGYSAVHYRVQLREQNLGELDKRYAKARVEIQVASVLMHAWSEVQHDLAYKQLGGDLSDQERAIIDQLNGLVIAGEISLQMLQQAGKSRVARNERNFLNHYELAAHLLSHANDLFKKPVGEAGLGRVDRLFDLLKKIKKTTPAELEPYLESLHGELEMRPLAEQVIDALLSEDPSLYKNYDKTREDLPSNRSSVSTEEIESAQALQRFLHSWVKLEDVLNELAGTSATSSAKGTKLPVSQLLKIVTLPPGLKGEIDYLRRVRNSVVHGRMDALASNLAASAQHLDTIIAEIEAYSPEEQINP
ncbi:GTP pyrophosphokinase family protein [Streptomyces sp. NPDC090499]|uniref:GTP pyrophosphokinase n=1 Tax=Streptomyces sp. NPDC090499 TaxID=3365965 RepID=UPI0037FB29B7